MRARANAVIRATKREWAAKVFNGWRIVNYAGDMVEESRDSFASIAAALVDGHRRLGQLGHEDMSTRAPAYYRSTSHLRSR